MRYLILLAGAAVALGGGDASAGKGQGAAGSKSEQARSRDDGRAEHAKKPRPRKADFLGKADIERVVAPYVPDIGACYKRHGLKQRRSTGELRLELVIHRDGRVKELAIDAPGVRGKRLHDCIHGFARGWRFPERRYFTTATVPFLFLDTKAPGAGPLHSCWSRTGCPSRARTR